MIKIRLADGRLYGQTGTLDFFDNSVAGNTDTMTLRGDVPQSAEQRKVQVRSARTGRWRLSP